MSDHPPLTADDLDDIGTWATDPIAIEDVSYDFLCRFHRDIPRLVAEVRRLREERELDRANADAAGDVIRKLKKRHAALREELSKMETQQMTDQPTAARGR
jgi:hypothetical protein